MPAFTEPDPEPPVTRGELAAWAVLFAALVATRWAVAPGQLFEWDSANYALAIEDVDVFAHRPHPPGYPLFVLLLKAASALWAVPWSFVAVNALLGALALAALGSMARRDLGPAGAWLLGLVFAACPLFWLYGAASTAYVAEACCAVGAGALGLAVLRGRLSLTWAALGWALLLGIRPNGALTLGPMMAWVGAQRREELVRAVSVGAAVCAGWLFPLIAESGGLGPFREATAALSDWQFTAGSALAGDAGAGWRNLGSLLTYVLDSVNVLALLALFALATRRLPRPATVLFFAVWLVPSSAYYVLHHLPKAGYALTVVPGVFLALALGAAPWRRVGAALGLAYVLLNGALFFVAVPLEAAYWEDAPELVPERVWMYGDYSARGLAYRTRPSRVLDAALAEADPERDAVLFLTGGHELHRIAMARHPELPLIAAFTEHGWCWSTRGEQGYGEWQLQVLGAPKLRGTDLRPTAIAWDGHRVRLERAGDVLDCPVEGERLLVVVPCAPCILANEGPAEAEARVFLGAGFTATWLRAR